MRIASYILCDQVVTVAHGRMLQYWGGLSAATMREVDERLRIVLGLYYSLAQLAWRLARACDCRPHPLRRVPGGYPDGSDTRCGGYPALRCGASRTGI